MSEVVSEPDEPAVSGPPTALTSLRNWFFRRAWPFIRTCLRAISSIVAGQLLAQAIMSFALLRPVDGVINAAIAIVALMILRPYVGCMVSYLLFLVFAYSIISPLNLGHLDDEGFYPDGHSPESAERLSYLVWVPTLAVLSVYLLRKQFGEGPQQKENVSKVVSKFVTLSPRASSGSSPADVLVRPADEPNADHTLLRPQEATQTDPQLLLKAADADQDEE